MVSNLEPLPGEIICPRDQRRRKSANVSWRWVKNSKTLEDWGETENLKAALDFSGGTEMWKAVRPGCSLDVPIWNAAQRRGCLLPILFARGQQIRHFWSNGAQLD